MGRTAKNQPELLRLIKRWPGYTTSDLAELVGRRPPSVGVTLDVLRHKGLIRGEAEQGRLRPLKWYLVEEKP